MKKYLLLSLFLCAFHILVAQKSEYNFGKVPDKQLEMTTYAADTSAAAVMLHDFGELQIMDTGSDYAQKFTRCRRIKILSRAGFDYGDLEIGYRSKDKSEIINDIKAVITLPNRQTYTYDKKDFFTEKKNEYWSVKKLAIANLEEGAVIDYYYKITSDRISQPREWYFQREIPVVLSELTIDFHSQLSYMYLFQGFKGMTIEENEAGEKIYTKGETKAIIEAKKFTTRNVPALKPEPYITTIDDYRLRLRFQLTDYYTDAGQKIEVLSDWTEVNQKMLYHEHFGKQYLKKSRYIEVMNAASATVFATGKSPLEVAIGLYDFLNNNIEVNYGGGIFTRNSLNDAFEKKSAKKGEMNLMLLALLREFDIDAHPVLISQRRNGRPLKEYPIVDQFSYVIVHVAVEGKEYFVECGNTLRPFGELSRNSMNEFGFMVKKKEGWEWKKIVPKKAKEVYLSDFTLDETAKMRGTIKANYTNTDAARRRYDWVNNEQEKEWETLLENSIADFELEEVTTENEKEVSKPFKLTFTGDFSGAAQEIGEFIYINPMIFAEYGENPFKSEERKYPVNFAYPFGNQFIINLKYDPVLYEIESLPEGTKFGLPNKTATVRYAAQEKAEGWIQVTCNLSVSGTLFSSEEYIGLRTLFDMTAEKLGEQIVLKRK